MRTGVVAIGFCLVNLVMAQAHGQTAAESIKPVTDAASRDNIRKFMEGFVAYVRGRKPSTS